MAEEKEPPLSASQRSRIRRLSQPKEHDPADGGGELNIVPFLDIVMNVLMFVLATLPAVFTVTIESNPPSIGSGSATRTEQKASLNLTAVVTSEGVALKASGGGIAPGCDGPGGGITVPKKAGAYDWDSLKTCVKKLKDASADFKDESNVQIIAEPGIDYQTVIQTMDAVRQDPQGEPLFPDVNFGVAK
jgi:biopolymer transport protein TolR